VNKVKYNVITIGLVAALLYPILKGFLLKYSTSALKETINSVIGSVSFVASIFIGGHYINEVFTLHNQGTFNNIYKYMPNFIISFGEKNPTIIRWLTGIALIIIIHSIIIFIFHLINNITLYPLFDGIDNNLKRKSNFTRRVFGGVFQIPKGICYSIILAFLLSFAAMLNKNENYLKALSESELYTYISNKVITPITNSEVIKNLPNALNDSFKIIVEDKEGKQKLPFSNYINKNVIVYYNGVTLEDGIKSNEQIDNFAINLVSQYNMNYDKAKTIYKWVGKEIEYDDNKALNVINNNMNIKSGAIEAFNTRQGVCFDYACLFIAMCRANDIKVRMVIGEGFNGKQWVNHSWNEFYDEKEQRWISVDPTFYSGGNYFDNNNFDRDHRNATIAGEW